LTQNPSDAIRASSVGSSPSGSWAKWSPAAEASPDADPPLVPLEAIFEGRIALVGRTVIEGSVRGSLRGSGELVLGPKARIEGEIECDILTSRGHIVGPVVARQRVRLAEGARMDGDLESPAIEVGDDAVWNGRARVGC